MADPALVFRRDVAGGGTHVLLIGIGDYPWIEGGAKCTTAKHHANAMGMGQLSSPPVSIRSLADWFLGEFDNPERPLASLSLLLSEPDPALYAHPEATPRAAPLPRGTIGDVEDAVAKWVERASGRRDNAMVFGFCGHGVQSSNPVLLCRDYGKNTESRFQGAIDFEQFRIALSTRQPDMQLLLVDACRTPDVDNSLLGSATPGNPLLAVESLTTRDNAPALQSVEFATSLYTQAWGTPDAPSLFTEALLAALASGGADRTDNWWVTTNQLHAALATYIARVALSEGLVQRPGAGSLQNFRVSKPVKISVPLYVRSNEPSIWGGKLRIEARRGNFVQGFDYHPPADGEARAAMRECAMRLVNPSQRVSDVVYDIHALFDPDSPYADAVEQIIAYPPEVTCDLPIGKRS